MSMYLKLNVQELSFFTGIAVFFLTMLAKCKKENPGMSCILPDLVLMYSIIAKKEVVYSS
jgi:hypothetical protein